MIKFIIPPKFQLLRKKMKTEKFKLLDVGCGNNSPSITKYWFSNCIYYGLDKNKQYNNTEHDINLMNGFYEIDLAKEQLDEIPNEYFDVIVMTHIIEHLFNGDEVIMDLITKLKSGGYMYIEYPSFKSVKFPSMKGTLNFFDDPTHCRLYSQMEMYNLFLRKNCTIVKGGTRRNVIYILLTPFRAFYDFIRYGYVNGSIVWDLMGFVEYVFIQKK